jgi:hypothetical protein
MQSEGTQPATATSVTRLQRHTLLIVGARVWCKEQLCTVYRNAGAYGMDDWPRHEHIPTLASSTDARMIRREPHLSFAIQTRDGGGFSKIHIRK